MQEKGIDISGARPKWLTLEMTDQADLVKTMGCSVEQVCPRPLVSKMQKKLIDWNLEGPKDKPIEAVRRIRDGIERRVVELRKGSCPTETKIQEQSLSLEERSVKISEQPRF